MSSIPDLFKTSRAKLSSLVQATGRLSFFTFCLCYLTIAAAALARIVYIVMYNPIHQIWSDPQRHWEQGVDVLRWDPMAMTDPIVYQLYIGTLGKLTLKDPTLVAFFTSILAISGPWLWYRFLRELLPSKLPAVIGWALLSLIPSWISIYGYFMQETLFIPMLGAALYLTWRAKRKQDVGAFVAMVIIWILAGLTRGIAIPMAAVACTWVWFEQDKKIIKAIYGVLILVFALGPLAYRAYKIVHIFAPHGIGYMNQIYAISGKKWIEITYEREGARWMYGFGSPATGSHPFAPLSDWMTQREGPVTAFVNLDKGMTDWKRELAANSLTLDRYLWITKENLIFLFQGESWPDSNLERAMGEINYESRWMWPPLTLIGIVLTVVYRRRLKGQWLFPSLILAWFFVQGLLPVVPNEGRYRKPFEGLLIVQLVLLASRRKSPLVLTAAAPAAEPEPEPSEDAPTLQQS